MIEAPLPGEMQLFDNWLPVLPAQDYDIVVEQQIALPPGHASPPPYRRVQRARVAGPHFGLAPDDVYATHPASGSQADYSATLPHIVLTRPSLPWEIAVDGPAAGPAVAPWMAVVTLTPGEWITEESSLLGTRTVPLADYLKPPAGTVGPDFTPQQIAELLRDNPDAHVVVVDVQVDAFRAILPARDELPFLAHARQVDVEAQELREAAGADGWFSVVVGNRLPVGDPDGVYVAHLVSLEGFAGDLPPGGRSLPPDAVAMRMLALASWSFNSRPGEDSFARIMAGLSDDVLRLPAEQLLPDPQSQPQRDVRAALDIGYAGLDYRTRLGERTVGWYRGPCLPVPMKPNPHHVDAVEAAMIYAPDTGMFDLSYAVAWQTGRMLALADRAFTASLTRWIREQVRLLHLGAERLALIERLSALDLPEDAAAIFAPDLMRRLATRYLARAVAPKLAPRDGTGPLLGPPRDPSGLAVLRARLPGLASPADLGQVLAAGGDPTRALIALLRERR